MAARDDESRDDERARYGPARSSRSLLGSCTLYSSVPASGLGTPGSVISLLLSSPSLSTSGPVPSRSGLRAMRHQVSTVCILEITIRVRFAFVYIFLVGNERLTRRRATDLRVARLTGADDRTSAAPTRRGGALYCSSRLPVRAAHATAPMHGRDIQYASFSAGSPHHVSQSTHVRMYRIVLEYMY